MPIPLDKIDWGDLVTFEDGDPCKESNVVHGRVRKVHQDYGTIVVDWDDGKTSSIRAMSNALISVGPYQR